MMIPGADVSIPILLTRKLRLKGVFMIIPSHTKGGKEAELS